MALKELEDYSWFPLLLRKWQSEYIGYISALLHLYPNAEQLFVKEKIIHDLCTGSGILAHKFTDHHSKGLIKSDKFPTNHNISQLDIFDLNPNQMHCYSIFNAFHHFTAEEQRHIINQFVDNNASFIIVEMLTPDVMTLLKVIFASVIIQPIISLFVKPFSIFRIITSTIFPLNLLTVLWDGCISVLKSKSTGHYHHILHLKNNQYMGINITRRKTKYGLPITVITNCKNV